MSILHGIALSFTNFDDVTALAVHLLEGVGSGGRVYVQRLKDSDSKIKPVVAAHDVLETWCTKKPTEAHGCELFRVLQRKEVCPQAAEDFRSELLQERGEKKLISSSVHV